jgi:SPP1 gp7 family putative phage head morphogenesis protein
VSTGSNSRNGLPASPPVPTAEDLASAFRVTPRAAIEWFESLGIRVAWNWQADLQAGEDLAFYVSKVMEQDVVLAIKQEIARALKLGVGKTQFRKFLLGRLAQLGWIGAREVVSPSGETETVDISTPARMDVIFRTNAQTAYNAGRYQAQLQSAAAAPYWQYVAVLDARTRSTHAAMNGKVFLARDSIWTSIYPPCGFNCRCRVRAMTETSFKASGLPLLDGHTFSLPPNFPDPGFGASSANPLSLIAALSGRENAARAAAGAL